MKGMIRRCLCVLTAAAVMLGSMGAAQSPVWAKSKDSEKKAASSRAVRAAVTVSTDQEFKNALQAGNSPITVNGRITLIGATDTDKRMMPVEVPAGTVIQGASNDSSINCRGPIQITGDGVCFKDIKLTFSSADVLNSVPHREIFLAGHSLTLDNVSTYLEGAGGPQGGLGSSEKELLPTVYGGGYSNTTVGSNASLTVKNSNDETMFKAIYMGNGEGTDNKVSYRGTAVLNLDAKATVRDVVETYENSSAEIRITGNGEQQVNPVRKFDGGENTTLTLNNLSINADVKPTDFSDSIGNIIVENKACLATATTDLKNIRLKSGGCLDLNSVSNPVTISGDFSGEEDSTKDRGILVLNPKGTLTIIGTVTGTTQFQTGSRVMPGTIYGGSSYIYATAGSESNFELADKHKENGFSMQYATGAWTVYRGTPPTQESTTSPTSSTTAPTQGTTTPTTGPTTAPTQKPTTAPTQKPTTAPTQGTTTSPTNPTTAPTGSTTSPTSPTGPAVTPPTEPTVTPPTQKPEDHKHQYQSTVTKQATCTEAGTRTYTCTCGHTYTEAIAPLEHQYVEERIPATTKADGKIQKVCNVCSHTTDVYVISKPRNPSWSKAEFTYDGKVKRPEVSIRDRRGSEMVPGSDYEVHYPKGMKNPGIYTVVVEYCGDYRGKVTKAITIKPRKASLKKVAPGSKKILVTWSRQTVQIDGYQVQYSRNQSFKGKTTKTVTAKRTASGTSVKKLKGKTKYYLRVRTYKTVKVSGKSKKVYSDWSAKKAVYTKR